MLPDGRVLEACKGLGDCWIAGFRNEKTGSSHRYRGLGTFQSKEEAEESIELKSYEIRATEGPAKWWTELADES